MKLRLTVHCCKCGWTHWYQAEEEHGVWLSLFNCIAANTTAGSNASTLYAG
jgi:hypothetical protein